MSCNADCIWSTFAATFPSTPASKAESLDSPRPSRQILAGPPMVNSAPPVVRTGGRDGRKLRGGIDTGGDLGGDRVGGDRIGDRGGDPDGDRGLVGANMDGVSMYSVCGASNALKGPVAKCAGRLRPAKPPLRPSMPPWCPLAASTAGCAGPLLLLILMRGTDARPCAVATVRLVRLLLCDCNALHKAPKPISGLIPSDHVSRISFVARASSWNQ